MNRYYLPTALTISLSLTQIAHGCTTVFANDKGPNKVVARTMDLYRSDEPLIKALPRGQQHNGQTGKNSMTWHSKYGSVVMTAFHTPTVSDGMNEKGLSAHLLYLTETEYPKPEAGAAQISNTAWVQYVLDNFSTVQEALTATKDLKVVATEVGGRTWPTHLTLEDASGDSAIIEFIHGTPKVYHGKEYQIMTNEPPYNIQLENLKQYKLFGGTRALPGDTDPLSRFVRVSTFLKTLPSTTKSVDAVADVLSVIRTAMVPFGAVNTSEIKAEDAWPTRWVSVADLTNKIYFFNATTAPNLIWIDLKDIDFSEGKPELTIDPTTITLQGNVSRKMQL